MGNTKEMDDYLAFYNSDEQKTIREQQYIETLPLAIEYIRKYPNRCDVTVLQRHFRISYVPASRILDAMEKDGMIGKWEGSKGRKVFIK